MERLATLFLATAEILESDEMPPFNFGKELLKMGVALFFLAAFVFLITFLIRKLARGRLKAFNHSSTIQILERRPIAPKAILYLLSVRGKEILIGYTPQGITPIYPLNTPSSSNTFEEILDEKLKR